jgi:rhombotail lipoprotein
VGLAFAPSGSLQAPGTFSEVQRQALLTRIAEAFKAKEGIGSVDVIPTTHLTSGGSFTELDRLKAAFGIDLAALVSYDQFQFSESGRSSWAYWTLVGAYVVEGEKNDTETLMDAVIYDIASRAMLFHATGQSRVKGSSTPVDRERELKKNSEESFSTATDDLIANLDRALAGFIEQAAAGTVRGAGTPAIAMYDASGRKIGQGEAGGAGALGGGELAAVAALALLAFGGMRGRARPR